MGQQLKVAAKRKRRKEYLKRKKLEVRERVVKSGKSFAKAEKEKPEKPAKAAKPAKSETKAEAPVKKAKPE